MKFLLLAIAAACAVANAASVNNWPVGTLQGTQVSTPGSPKSGTDYLYFKSDDNLYKKTSAGIETIYQTVGPTGASGVTGASGSNGSSGVNGNSGSSGASGVSGATGATGTNGITGPTGTGGGSSAFVSKSGNYNILTTDGTIEFTAAATGVLPTAVGVTGQQYTIKHGNTAFNLVVAGTGTQTVEGLAPGSLSMGAANDAIGVESDGSNWFLTFANWTIESIATRITSNYTTVTPNYILILNSLVLDTCGTTPCYNTSTGVFTAPIGGTYQFTFIGLAATAGAVALGKNGTTIAGPTVFASVASGTYYSGTTSLHLAATDTIEINSYANGVLGALQFYDANNTYFTAQRVGN